MEIRERIVAAGAWKWLSYLVAHQNQGQNKADDEIRLAACELMTNLSLTP
jgi:hypothetical protein